MVAVAVTARSMSSDRVTGKLASNVRQSFLGTLVHRAIGVVQEPLQPAPCTARATTPSRRRSEWPTGMQHCQQTCAGGVAAGNYIDAISLRMTVTASATDVAPGKAVVRGLRQVDVVVAMNRRLAAERAARELTASACPPARISSRACAISAWTPSSRRPLTWFAFAPTLSEDRTGRTYPGRHQHGADADTLQCSVGSARAKGRGWRSDDVRLLRSRSGLAG